MVSSPLFSVIIPTYHRNDLLRKCLDCLKPGTQTLAAGQYEVVVTDDGTKSTAGHMIQNQYPWAKWVAGPCRGPAANRNNGAEFAQGYWLIFTDDDCLPDVHWLEAFQAAVIPEIYVYEGKTTCKTGIHSPLQHAPTNNNGGCLWSCNMMISKNSFFQVNGFDETFLHPHMEDVDLKERLDKQDFRISFVDQAIVDHPPKILPGGSRLGMYQENYFYFFKKRGAKNITRRLVRAIFFSRINAIRRNPKGLDSLICIASLVTQLVYVLFHIRSWEQKYKFHEPH